MESSETNKNKISKISHRKKIMKNIGKSIGQLTISTLAGLGVGLILTKTPKFLKAILMSGTMVMTLVLLEEHNAKMQKS